MGSRRFANMEMNSPLLRARGSLPATMGARATSSGRHGANCHAVLWAPCILARVVDCIAARLAARGLHDRRRALHVARYGAAADRAAVDVGGNPAAAEAALDAAVRRPVATGRAVQGP